MVTWSIPSLQQPSLMPPPPQENKLSLRWSRPPLPRPLGAASASASAPSSAAASRVPQKTLAGGSRSPRFGLERMWNNRVRLSLLKPCPSPSQPRTTWTLISLHHQFHWGGPEWVPFKCTREVIQLVWPWTRIAVRGRIGFSWKSHLHRIRNSTLRFIHNPPTHTPWNSLVLLPSPCSVSCGNAGYYDIFGILYYYHVHCF